MAGIKVNDEHQASDLHLKSFQVLSCVAPLIWMSEWSTPYSVGLCSDPDDPLAQSC